MSHYSKVVVKKFMDTKKFIKNYHQSKVYNIYNNIIFHKRKYLMRDKYTISIKSNLTAQ